MFVDTGLLRVWRNTDEHFNTNKNVPELKSGNPSMTNRLVQIDGIIREEM